MIGAEFRGSAGQRKTDQQVREALGVSSVEVEITKRRLCYLATVARAAPLALRALHQKHGGQPLDWVKVVINDISVEAGGVNTFRREPRAVDEALE